MDIDDGFILTGYDGPSNVDVAAGWPRLAHVEVHHGKSGHGLSVDSDLQQGLTKLLNRTQFGAGDAFRMVLSLAEAVPGPIPSIGNPNCRVRVSKPLHEFIDDWRQQGPSHHTVPGVGEHSGALETVAEAIGFGVVRV